MSSSRTKGEAFRPTGILTCSGHTRTRPKKRRHYRGFKW